MQKTTMFCDWCGREIVECSDYYKCSLYERQSISIVHFKNQLPFEFDYQNEGKDFCGPNCLIKFISENLSRI